MAEAPRRIEPASTPRTREQTKRDTRDALIVAGIAAFSEEGLDAPSLDSICARAGFTRGAFYVHFKDRDEFLVAVMDSLFGALLDNIIATGDAALDLERTIEGFVALASGGRLLLEGSAPYHQFLAACGRSPKVRARFVRVLDEAITRVTTAVLAGQRAETVRADVEPRDIARLLTVIALGYQSVVEVSFPVDVLAVKDSLLRLLALPGPRPAP
jgi:TetR/AcrR family transcriptional regulator, transcriptional repressor for nem operon